MAREQNPVVQWVAQDVSAGRVTYFRRGGAEFRQPHTVPGYWICEDGVVWTGDKMPCRTVRSGPTGTDVQYVPVYVNETRRSVPLARLVLAVFRGAAPNGHSRIKHKDGDAYNCRADNLEYARPKRAQADALRVKKGKSSKTPQRNLERTLSPGEIRHVIYLAGKGGTAESIATRLCCSELTVEKVMAEVYQREKNARIDTTTSAHAVRTQTPGEMV